MGDYVTWYGSSSEQGWRAHVAHTAPHAPRRRRRRERQKAERRAKTICHRAAVNGVEGRVSRRNETG